MYTDSLNIFVLDLNIICKIINCFLKTLKALKTCSITVTELLFHEKGPFDIVIIFFEAIVSMIDIWQILLLQKRPDLHHATFEIVTIWPSFLNSNSIKVL